MVSSIDSFFCRAAQSCGDVGSGCKLFVHPSCATATEKSLLCASSAPTCKKDDSCSFNSPNRCSANCRILEGTSGSPHPTISSMWAVNAPTALPVSRKTENRQGSKFETWQRDPTLFMYSSEFNRCFLRERRNATGASCKPWAGAFGFQVRFAHDGPHSVGGYPRGRRPLGPPTPNTRAVPRRARASPRRRRPQGRPIPKTRVVVRTALRSPRRQRPQGPYTPITCAALHTGLQPFIPLASQREMGHTTMSP